MISVSGDHSLLIGLYRSSFWRLFIGSPLTSQRLVPASISSSSPAAVSGPVEPSTVFPPSFSVALAFFPFLCLFLLFLGSTTFHSLPSCPLESDGNREVLPAAVGSFLVPASVRLLHRPRRRSSIALIIEGPRSSIFLSNAEKRGLSPSPSFGGQPIWKVEAPHRKHS